MISVLYVSLPKLLENIFIYTVLDYNPCDERNVIGIVIDIDMQLYSLTLLIT